MRRFPDSGRWARSRLGWELRYLLRALPFVALVAGLLLPFLLGAYRGHRQQAETRLPVRIFFSSAEERKKVFELGVQDVIVQTDKYLDANVTGWELLALRRNGLDVALIVEVDTTGTAPVGWPTVEEVEARLRQLAARHPDIARCIEIGRSSYWHQPIWALKISDRVAEDEDEPAILLSGGIHAREPLGMLTCLHIAEQLCERYPRDPKVREWVRELAIYVVPLLNPDGYRYLIEKHVNFPWWRKNLTDNDGDGSFDPERDGVDLNRNFAFNWEDGGSDDPTSWFYRGPRPFSEPETRAFRDFALQVLPVAGISYHSHGEVVLYPWSNYARPVDRQLLEHMAFQMASLMEKRAGREHYAAMPLNGRVGQSSCWLYGALGCFDFTVEVGDEYFPELEAVPDIVREAAKAAYYLFDRVRGSGLWLRVVDALTGTPLCGEVRVLELGEGPGSPRRSDPFFGRVRWLLSPGSYTVSVAAREHVGVTREVEVVAGRPTELEVELVPTSQVIPAGNQ